MSPGLGVAVQDEVDARWQGPGGAVLVEFKKTHSMRDVRHALLTLAYLIRREPPSTTAVCVLVDSRLSDNRLRDELQQLTEVIRPEIAKRIHYLIANGDADRDTLAFTGSLAEAPSEFYSWLRAQGATVRPRDYGVQLPRRQRVIAALAQFRLRNLAPVAVKHLQDVCGVSYPTAVAVLNEINRKGWLEESSEPGVRLRPLTVGEWIELGRDHARERPSQLFTDPTSQSTPEQMARRLARLQATDKLPPSVRVGGVLGATGHFPALDITAAPRLDISLDAEPTRVAALLDAGLEPKTRPEQRVALAVHVTREPFSHDTEPEARSPWAGELECLADLLEMGYAREACEFARHMESINKAGRPAA